MRKFYIFAASKLDLRIKWITKETKTLFKLKYKCLHPACTSARADTIFWLPPWGQNIIRNFSKMILKNMMGCSNW